MANNPRGYQRDKVTGRFARRPVEGVDADSRFGPMADSIEDIDNVSGAPSPNTEMHARYAPAGDAQGGERSPLRARRPEMVPDLESPETIYGSHLQAAVSRAAARRDHGDMDPTAWLTGADDGLPR